MMRPLARRPIAPHTRPSLWQSALAAIALGAGSASADTVPSVNTRSWLPSSFQGAQLATEPVSVPKAGEWGASGWVSYERAPLTTSSLGPSPFGSVVSDAFRADLAFGIGLGRRVALGAVLPTTPYQDGAGNLPFALVSGGAVSRSAVGDAVVALKANLRDNDAGGLGLAVTTFGTIPTGDRASFTADGAPRFGARILADYSFLIASLQASVGYTFRTEVRRWPDGGDPRFGDAIPWAIGARVRPVILGVDTDDRHSLELALRGALPAGPVGPFGSGSPGSSALTPVSLTASDQVRLGHDKDAFVLVGAELGLTDAIGVPIAAFVVGFGLSKRGHDIDGDGVRDDVDSCAEIPEDKDGFEDGDGCPEIDNDEDDIVDTEDACPNVAGPRSNDPKRNGCPGA